MLISSRQRLSTLTDSLTIKITWLSLIINDNQVSQVTTAKSLGVTIDNKLDWSSHIDKLTKKVASGIGAIKRIRHLVPEATLHLIYQALIQPHFDYCNIVWGNCGTTLQNKVQKLQNKTARVLTYSNYDADAGYLFELLGWKNLASQQQIQRATMVYKPYLCNFQPIYNALRHIFSGTTYILFLNLLSPLAFHKFDWQANKGSVLVYRSTRE